MDQSKRIDRAKTWRIRGSQVKSLIIVWLQMVALVLSVASVGAQERLFPNHLPHARWVDFPAQGFSTPVTGVIYRGAPRPTCGMPLGGIDTGCLDIEPNGMLGYCTIFNQLHNPRRLINQPFLGLSVEGRTWVLISDKKAKRPAPVRVDYIDWPPLDYTPKYDELELEGVEIADSIDYWGHYPIVDMEYETSAPVEIGLRAWSPFIPGDTITSMMPATMFEITVRNPTDKPRKGTVGFSFPGFETSSGNTLGRRVLDEELNGAMVRSGVKDEAWQMSYILAALNEPKVRLGGPLGVNGQAWASMDDQLPDIAPFETGTSLAWDFELASGEKKTLRIVLAWMAPYWRGGGNPHSIYTKLFEHMYVKHWGDLPFRPARYLAANHESLLRRVIAWQEAIYSDPQTPGWLADQLINHLHLITETALWGQAKPPIGEWCRPEDGLFGMNEVTRCSGAQIECIPCSFYGNMPLVYFFPDAALSTLRAYKAYQFEDGRPPWTFDGKGDDTPFDLSKPYRGYQVVLNGACYIAMVDRYWRVSGDDAILVEFWDSLKRANDFTLNLRPAYGDSQVVAMPQPDTDEGAGTGADTEWFEAPEPGWKGYVTHAGGVRMAQAALMRRMAEKMGDAEYVKQCDAWLDAGAKALEEKLWNGTYYLNFFEPETGLKSDLVFGYQLDGQWICHWQGVPGVFPKQRVDTVLDTIRRINCALSQSGAVNYANPDGSPAQVGGYGTFSYFPPELFMLAMTYMYEGEREFGMDLLYRCLENIVCKWGYTWDAPNIMRGDLDTGERRYGSDYYQNMMLWAVPAALNNQDLTGPLQAGGLVSRVIEAGRSE